MVEKKGCQKPENLECSPEKIRECHGSDSSHPCKTSSTGCQKPDKLECSPEKIRECHGSDDHPCT